MAGGDPAVRVQLLILGIVGEYLGRLYMTANGKPQSVVKSVTTGNQRVTKSPGGRCERDLCLPPPRSRRRPRQVCVPANGREPGPAMAIYYTSLAAAVLFGIAGQIALKSGALASPSVAAQFVNPLTIVGFGIYVLAAFCYIVALRKSRSRSHFRRSPTAMRSLRSSHILLLERAVRLAADRRHNVDRRWHPACPPALIPFSISRLPVSPFQGAAQAGVQRRRIGQLLALDDARLGRARATRTRKGVPTHRIHRPRRPAARSGDAEGSAQGCASRRYPTGDVASTGAPGACRYRLRRRRGKTALSVNRSDARTS